MFRNKKKKNGFTVAEVVVAAAIFMVFSGALFSIYRMGSRMFVSGSWKYSRQKEAERFFEILKERVEQASNIVKIAPNETPQISTKPTVFKTKTGTLFEVLPGQRSSKPNKQLTEFAVCKPCQVIGEGKKGIIVLHSLTLVPDDVTGLYDLCLRVKRIDDHNNTDYFSFGSADALSSPPSLQLSDFLGEPSDFGLQPVPAVYKLRDVCSVTIEYSQGLEESAAKGDMKAIKPSLFDIKVKMRNPKHEQTVLEMGYKCKIDGSVDVEAVN